MGLQRGTLQKVVAALPGVFTLLGALVAKGFADKGQEAAAAALANLALGFKCARMVTRETGYVRGLIVGLYTLSADALTEVRKALRNLSAEANG